MKVETQPHGHITVVVPHGPLVSDELDDLRRSLTSSATAKAKRIIFDLADVPYLDSGGIELLLELCGPDVLPHQRPKIAALSETCREALELTNSQRRLEVFDTVENALRSCQR